MLGRLRHWADVGAVSACLAFGVPVATGYLPAVGPVPLRFRPAVPSATNLVRMPLPPPDLPPSAPSIAADNAPKPFPPAANPSSAPVLPSAASGPAAPDATPLESEPKVSPQMLLRYFNRPTNGAAGGIIAPMNFAPPTAAKPPSSTATYSTDPK